VPLAAQPASPAAATRWFKGNTHTHTLNSDGDSTPDDVVHWYREHGYQFVVLTDHNFLTSVEGLNALHGASQRFLVVKGEELTDRADGKPLHINGLDLSREIPPQGGSTVAKYSEASTRFAAPMGAHQHPNFGWAITPDQICRWRTTAVQISTAIHRNNVGVVATAEKEVWGFASAASSCSLTRGG
jgi:hypothetical protein